MNHHSGNESDDPSHISQAISTDLDSSWQREARAPLFIIISGSAPPPPSDFERPPHFILDTHLEMSRPRSRRGARERTEALQGMLFQATVTGCAEVVERLLARDDIDVNKAETDNGCTPLCEASQNGHTEVVERLLARDDIDVNKATTSAGVTPLLMASANGHTEVVGRLLTRDDIDVNKAMTSDGSTPLYGREEVEGESKG